ncbi:MAG: hypothetical protein PVG12_07915 [Gammaproteobacteria bacterium]|jgi:hypothetical protein
MVATSLVLPVWALLCGNTESAALPLDDSNGSSIDETAWRLPVDNGTLYGRTQVAPPFFNEQNLRPEVAGGNVTLQLDT